MSRREIVPIENRDVHIYDGRLSQTVNVCDARNQVGKYEWVVRLQPPHFVTPQDLQPYHDIPSLIDWLEESRSGDIERRPDPASSVVPVLPKATRPTLSASDTVWVQRAMEITEICIDEMLREFLEMPYLHRVEHSVHVRLHSILSVQPHFFRHYPLKDGRQFTQPIHKEWPEFRLRPDKPNRRGNFDLAILPPGLLSECSPENFATGNVAAPIVIEMGLNYGDDHLAADAEKLLNSDVLHGYLVHLVREAPSKGMVETTIDRLVQEGNVKVGFAEVKNGQRRLKLLKDIRIGKLY